MGNCGDPSKSCHFRTVSCVVLSIVHVKSFPKHLFHRIVFGIVWAICTCFQRSRGARHVFDDPPCLEFQALSSGCHAQVAWDKGEAVLDKVVWLLGFGVWPC